MTVIRWKHCQTANNYCRDGLQLPCSGHWIQPAKSLPWSNLKQRLLEKANASSPSANTAVLPGDPAASPAQPHPAHGPLPHGASPPATDWPKVCLAEHPSGSDQQQMCREQDGNKASLSGSFPEQAPKPQPLPAQGFPKMGMVSACLQPSSVCRGSCQPHLRCCSAAGTRCGSEDYRTSSSASCWKCYFKFMPSIWTAALKSIPQIFVNGWKSGKLASPGSSLAILPLHTLKKN